MTSSRLRSTAVVLMAVALALTGCAATTPGVSATKAAGLTDETSGANLDGVHLTVEASPAGFPGQAELCAATVGVLVSAGADVTQKCSLPDPGGARQALLSGSTDLYWGSLATAWNDDLHQTTRVTDPGTLYRDVATQDLKAHGVTWLTPAPVTIAPAFIARQAGDTTVHSLSQYASLAKTEPAQARVCLTAAFETDPAGWPLLEKTYGFTLPPADIATVTAPRLVGDVAGTASCRYGETDTVSGTALASTQVSAVRDGQDLFTPSPLALTMREATSHRHPYLARLLAGLSRDVTPAALQSMTMRVAAKHVTPQTAAEQWLQTVGLVS